MEKYKQLKVLGKGSFGSAWLIQRNEDRAQFVAKEVRLGGLKPAERESAQKEIDMLRTLNHPNITRYVDHFEHKGSLFIVMEYANGGDLYMRIKQQQGQLLSEKGILQCFSQICLALSYMHERRILHRDLKTQNVFLTKDGVVKVGDFGISTVLRNTYELKHTICGTPYYFSPELCLNKPYNNKSDVWALGCILYEMTTLNHAFDGSNMKALVQKILKGVYPPIHLMYSSNLSRLISSMLQIDPHKRPNVSQVLDLNFIREALAGLREEVQVARADRRSVVSVEERAQMQEAAGRRKEEYCRKELESAASVAKAQQQQQAILMQQQLEGEERRRNLVEQQRRLQRQQELALQERKRALDERVREQRKLQGQKAKADAKAHRHREKQWDDNIKEQVIEEQRRREAEEHHCRSECQGPPQPQQERLQQQQQEQSAAEAYREMRRQAAANKQRCYRESVFPGGAPCLQQRQQDEPSAVPAGQPPPPRTPPSSSHYCSRKMTPEELEDARSQAFWQMRREAMDNRKKMLDHDVTDTGESQAPTSAEAATGASPAPSNGKSTSFSSDPVPPQMSTLPPPPSTAATEKKPSKKLMSRKDKSISESTGAQLPASSPAPAVLPPPGAAAAAVVPQEGDNSMTPDGEEGLHNFLNGEAAATSPTEAEDRRRDDDYNALDTVIGETLKADRPTNFKDDFDDAAFGEATDSSRLVLDGKTFHLPNVSATDPLMHRIESLRIFLEKEMGDDDLIKCYRAMNNISASDDEVMHQLQNALPPSKQRFIPLVAHLVVCEDAFNRQGASASASAIGL
ncbi:putative serine/threonine-protein kinase [Leishmania mexicana MHOM/GT/2001/U1103]|uniref:non-specific serine/threonine protein kinase n=1 Tax=Leishmania mexicana (strain MHOM/GT/2001/U1103) TaxID=929439 RepID=E9AVE6_LEIMU|nr:putative serine/threonine-protein kinase [Leishmania mexicana MHOM/GT/2001/U1103]CBZ26928.1 putative serine/threonine-protein kinase [Leishmania mexicana MHOM/GT/2001/U1103]